MRRSIIVLATLAATVALAVPAGAVPPSPNHTPSVPLGRVVATFNHGGNPATGQVTCSAQGERIDGPDANNQAEALRGRAACLENNLVIRLRIHDVSLEVLRGGVWQTVARDDNDLVVSTEPAHAIWYTPVAGFCPGNTTMLTYRVINRAGIRWSDAQATNVTVASNPFQARATVNTGIC
jgi:hypothetical protein